MSSNTNNVSTFKIFQKQNLWCDKILAAKLKLIKITHYNNSSQECLFMPCYQGNPLPSGNADQSGVQM